jgi:hypothetical protein
LVNWWVRLRGLKSPTMPIEALMAVSRVYRHLVHGALVTVDGLDHAFEHRVEDLPRHLGIAVGDHFHRPLHVGKEHRHLLPLALQRCFRGEDAFGEVLGV